MNVITANIARVRKDVLAWLPNVETIQRDVKINRFNTCSGILNVYDTQFAIP